MMMTMKEDEDELSNEFSELNFNAEKSTSLEASPDEKESELLSGALSRATTGIDTSTIGLPTATSEATACLNGTAFDLNASTEAITLAKTAMAMDHSILTGAPHNGIGDQPLFPESHSVEEDDSRDVVDWSSLTVYSGDFMDAATEGPRQSKSLKRNRVQSNALSNSDLEIGRTGSEHDTELHITLPSPRPETSHEAREDISLATSNDLSRDVPANATSTSNNANSSNSGEDAAVPSEGHLPIAIAPAAYFNLCLTRLLCVPMVLLLSISTVLVVVLLVLIPGMLFLAVSVGFYYCCTRDAIPLRVLIQAMLWDAESENGSTSTGGVTSRLSSEEIQAALIRRTCLAVVKRSETPTTLSTPATPLVEPEIQGAADYIFVHDYFTYYFSKPLQNSLDGLSHRGVHSATTSEGTAGLESLLETMNARHANSVSWTDTDDDIASDRAVIQRPSRPRRPGNSVSSRQSSDQEGIELQASTARISAVEETVTSSIQPSASPQTAQCQAGVYDELADLVTPPVMQSASFPSSELPPISNVISTISESLDEAGNECCQNFDEIWDNVSLASVRHKGLNRKSMEGRKPTATQTGPEATTEVPSTYELEHESEGDRANENDNSFGEPHTDKLLKEDDESCSTSVLRRGIACDICLIHYTVNDVLAWSHNPLCSHVFHSDCITDWMQRNHHCPNCRSDFLFYEHYQKQIMKEANSSVSISVGASPPDTAPARAEVHM